MSVDNVPSLKSRYAYKLLTNLTSIPLYLAMEAILPRALGPQMYGNFYFINNFFNQIITFLDMGTSACFCTSLARRPNNYSIVAFYAHVSLAIFILIFLTSLIVMLPAVGNILTPNIPLWIIPLGAIWAFLYWWNKILLAMNDAIGLTVKSEIIRSIFYLIGIMVLVSMYFTNTLNIQSLFIQQYLVVSLMSATYYWVIKNYWPNLTFKLNARQFKAFIGHFFQYCHPLFVQMLILFIYLTYERWLLQYFSGSIEYGYFTLANKIGTACLIFALALTPLLMRELVIAWSKHNLELMKQLIEKYSPSLYFIVGYFSCFVAIEGERIAFLFGGSEFASAGLTVQLVGLYPAFQVYAAIAGSFFLATGKTRYLRNLTLLEICISFPLVWFLLAPEEYFGLNLGATGLAFKYFIMQFFMSSLSFWVVSKLININYWKTLLYQITTLAVLLLIAFACYSITTAFLQINQYLRFLISGFSYSCLALLLLIAFPQIAGLNRTRLNEYFKKLFVILKLKKAH